MDPERTAAKPRPQPTEASAPSSSSDDEWGTYFLGPYRVVDEIGVGGMATVELARMDGAGGFQKWVAIKRIHPHLTEDQQFINMFLDEARIAASISHPNVAQVFDLGKHENTYWIAMEYLHGEPLREIMRVNEETQASIEPELAARVIADAAEGLHAAHELRGKDGRPLNLVHRDVTPHNLFITYDGVVKVVDFGIAKVTDSLSNTHAGTIKGKIAYMSPEQVRGKKIDRRTDVFALGVVLWEMTTGRRLFRVESDLGTLSRVEACVVPPPSALDEDYPPELESVLLKALQREPEDRYQTAREFSRALQKFLMGSRMFVGPEEVSAYVKDLFSDRVAKREDHLRWAAEVTQTISIRKALTQEDAGDLLDLSKLPREGDSESMEFDTIREQPAPRVEGVPSPLGRTGSVSTTQRVDREDPFSRMTKSTPTARKELGRQRALSATEAVARPGSAPASEADDDDDEDEAETLIASAPQVLGNALSALGKGRLKDVRGLGSPLGDDADDPDTMSRTEALPGEARGAHVSLDDVEGDIAGKGRATAPWNPDDAARATATSGAEWEHRPGPPVFDKHSSPAAETMQLRVVRRSASPLVVFAAAVGAGFVAAGFGAIWWVQSTSSKPSVPSANVTVSSPSAPPTKSSSYLPALAPPTMSARGRPSSPGAEEAPAPIPEPTPRRETKPAPEKVEPKESNLVDSLPDLPPDPSEEGEALRPGFLSVFCKPPCDRVVVAGSSFGGAMSRASMPPGQHKVQCIRGDITKVISVIVVSDQHTSQGISME